MENSHLATCPVCGKYEQQAKTITKQLNKAQNVTEKGRYASELLELESMLSSCPTYAAGDPECQAHRQVVQARRKMTEMIARFHPLEKSST